MTDSLSSYSGSASSTAAFATEADGSPFQHPLCKAWQSVSSAVASCPTTYTVMVTKPSGATVPYEKMAGYDYLLNGDASTAALNFDGVARLSHAQAAPGNTNARLWGANLRAFWPSGTDGYGCGAEIDMQNNGTGSDVYGASNNKFGVHVCASGTAFCTAGVHVNGNTSQYGGGWYDGVAVNQASVSNYAFKLYSGSNVIAGMDAQGTLWAPSFNGASIDAQPWTAFTPSVTANTGSDAVAQAVSGSYKRIGKTLHFRFQVTVAYTIQPIYVCVAIPFTFAAEQVVHGYNGMNNALLACKCDVGTGNVYLSRYDGASPVQGSGDGLVVSGTVEIQ